MGGGCVIFGVGHMHIIYIVLSVLSKNNVVVNGRGALVTLFFPNMA